MAYLYVFSSCVKRHLAPQQPAHLPLGFGPLLPEPPPITPSSFGRWSSVIPLKHTFLRVSSVTFSLYLANGGQLEEAHKLDPEDEKASYSEAHEVAMERCATKKLDSVGGDGDDAPRTVTG